MEQQQLGGDARVSIRSPRLSSKDDATPGTAPWWCPSRRPLLPALACVPVFCVDAHSRAIFAGGGGDDRAWRESLHYCIAEHRKFAIYSNMARDAVSHIATSKHVYT
jgi:hypothetical protein